MQAVSPRLKPGGPRGELARDRMKQVLLSLQLLGVRPKQVSYGKELLRHRMELTNPSLKALTIGLT